MKTYDIIVIGGGRASTLAMKAAKAGKSVALIEKDRLGGTCPNNGCVPSKLLIGYADVAKRIREGSRHHISATLNSIDREQIFADISEWIGAVDPRYKSRFPDSLDLYRGAGSFVSNKVVEVNGEQLTAENIVIGTGARSRPASFPELPTWTSDDIFPLKGKVPESIAIVGGGFIACELANVFHSLGIQTTVLVRGSALLPVEDAAISEIFKQEFSEYVPTKFRTTISSATHDEGGFQLKLSEDGKETELAVEALLYATGRVPNSDDLGIENTDIVMNERGFIPSDENLQTNIEGVYSMGDVAGRHQLQHASSFEVNYLVERLLSGNSEPCVFPPMPHAVFTDPEIAAVGLTEQDIEKSGIDPSEVVIVESDWRSSARMLSWRIEYPLTKLIVRKSDYSILGCHMIGPESSTMIHQVLTVMHLDNDIRKLADMIYIHPALPEALQSAVQQAIQKIEES